MPKYNVGVKEVHYKWVVVEAENEEEALEKAENEEDIDYLEYSYTLPKDEWIVAEYPATVRICDELKNNN